MAVDVQRTMDYGNVRKIINLPDPSAAQDAATKAYVDSKVSKFAQNIGDGTATSYAVAHNLNTKDVEVEVYRNSAPFDSVIVEIQRTDVNTVTVVFDTAPATNAFRVVVKG